MMKKFAKTVIIICVLLTCMACGKIDVGESVASTFPSNEETTGTVEATTQPTMPDVETTTDPGIMPNTAGIVVRETTAEKETTTAEVPGNKRGMGRIYDSDIHLADEDAKRLGVSKILVLQTVSSCTWKTDEDIISKFNELLVTKYGCDFVVGFIGDRADVDRYGYTYYDFLKDVKEMGQQADIIMTGAPAYYTRLVEEDFLTDISGYLATEDGKKLYEAYPEEIWESIKINGKIYGYTAENMPADEITLNCNREVAERLGIKVDEGYSFYDIGKILESANLSSDNIEGIVPIYIGTDCFSTILGYNDLGRGIYAKKNEDGSWTAFNAAEDEEVIRLWKVLREYKEKGWLMTEDTAYSMVNAGDFLFAGLKNNFNYSNMAIGNKLKMILGLGKAETTVIYDVIPGKRYYSHYGILENYVYGISSWSEYKKEALKLITLISTEAELANLLVYGIENDHYVYKDKAVRALPSADGVAMGDTLIFVNRSLLYSQHVEPDNKLEYYKEVSSNYESSAIYDYGISVQDYFEFLDGFEQRSALHQIYAQGYEKLFSGEYEDVDAAVAEINRMQKEAGIDELIDKINTILFKKNVE